MDINLLNPSSYQQVISPYNTCSGIQVMGVMGKKCLVLKVESETFVFLSWITDEFEKFKKQIVCYKLWEPSALHMKRERKL